MRILVALSGGLDSAASVLLLKQGGFDGDIEALFVDMHDDAESIRQAKTVADTVGVKLHVANCSEEFRKEVVGYFLDEVNNGKTPTVCAFCNPNFKFKVLLEYADKMNFDAVATGHYVQKKQINEKWYITRGVDNSKDQSYFLWGLTQEQIQRTIFPLGGVKKSDVREFLNQRGFQNIASTKESMSLCFLSQSVDFKCFIEQNATVRAGDVLDTLGNRVGVHDGFQLYTIGQKRGFKLFDEEVREIVRIDSSSNSIVVSENKNDLYKRCFSVKKFRITDFDEFFSSTRLTVKIRGLGRNPIGYCTVGLFNDTIQVILDSDAWAIASGQSAVFYIDDRVVGGGVIV